MFARRLHRSSSLRQPFLFLSRHPTRRLFAASTVCRSSPALPNLAPREFPTNGFEVIEVSEKVEEERLPFYNRDEYYPVFIGMVLKERYQVVAKLGYGTSSTVWLAHDLKLCCLVLSVHWSRLTFLKRAELLGSKVPHPNLGTKPRARRLLSRHQPRAQRQGARAAAPGFIQARWPRR